MEIDRILEELQLENTSIQKIRQPDFRTLLLDLYAPGKRRSLLISLAQGKTRLHARRLPVGKSTGNKVALQRFAQFLRSRVGGGKITDVHQLGRERIVQMDILRGGELTRLFIRLWGGAGNIIAVDDTGMILDAFYRRPRRGEVTGGHFDPEEVIRATRKGGGVDRTAGTAKEFALRPCSEGLSLNETVELEYHRREQEEKLSRLKERAGNLLEQRKSNIELKLAELKSGDDETEEGDRYREIGDLLKSNLHRIPSGAKFVTLPDFFHGDENTEIELNPALSALENAEAYYRKSRKTRRKNALLLEEEENLRESLSFLQRENAELAAIESSGEAAEASMEDQLRFCEQIIEKYTPSKGEDRQASLPGLRFRSGAFTLMVGRNSKENDVLLRRFVRGNDYWLHTRDYPGGYVFIKYISGKTVPLETLLDAGNLALHYSKGRASGKAELYYTQVKYLRRVREGREGLVIPTQEKNLSIRLDEERLHKIMNSPLHGG